MTAFLGIIYTDFGSTYIKGEMEITDKVRQPYGYLHGGASLFLQNH